LSATRDEPDDLQASLAYGKWREAMNEECDALMKIKRGYWYLHNMTQILWIVDGSTRSREELMGQLIDTRLD
jgi:hypothetical protein